MAKQSSIIVHADILNRQLSKKIFELVMYGQKQISNMDSERYDDLASAVKDYCDKQTEWIINTVKKYIQIKNGEAKPAEKDK